MLTRTPKGIVFESDWNRNRIGAGIRRLAPTTGCDVFVQQVFCVPRVPQMKEPRPVEPSPYLERLEAFLNR